MPSPPGLGCDNGGDFRKNLLSQRFGLYGQSPTRIVIEAHSPDTQLFWKHPILRAKVVKVVKDLPWAVVHRPGNSHQHKPERIDPSRVFKTHDRDRRAALPNQCIFMEIQFSDHTPSSNCKTWTPAIPRRPG
jgi:hypothetical protein